MYRIRFIFFTLTTLIAGPVGAAPLSVIASIKPVHSLVAGVMSGVGAPDLLVDGAVSEHGYALRPSQAGVLARADMVFWVGPQLETFLIRPLQELPPGVGRAPLAESPGVRLLTPRDADTLAPLRAGPQDQAWDMHIWLDPENAVAMVRDIAARLSVRDPANAAAYAKNAAAMQVRLAASIGLIRDRLAVAPVPPFMVYHDAYQYFEARFGVHPVAIISPDPHRPPGAARVRALRQRVIDARVACVFAEPQFEPRLIQTLTEGAPARISTLDPLGAGLAAGGDMYFHLLDQMAGALTGCASGK